MIRRSFGIFLFLACWVLLPGVIPAAEKPLPSAADFQTVPDDCRPWAYYFWIKGNVTKESITADLTRMKELGFGGVLVFDSRGYHEDGEKFIPVPVPIRHEFMSDSWQELILHLISEADRLGMKVSINLSNTGGYLRGPWDFAGDGPRSLIVSSFVPAAGQPVKLPLEKPENQRYYRDAVLAAIRVDPPPEATGKFSPWKPAAPPAAGAPRVLETVDLSGQLHSGELDWTPPEGENGWMILRFGSAVIGETGSVDILNPDVISTYYEKMAGVLLRRAAEIPSAPDKPVIGRTLTSFYNVSWEGGNPNWTDGFDSFFAAKRGYELFPYMPVLAGMIVQDADTSRRFMNDFHKTVANAFCENCYRKIGELCHRDGVTWHSEDGGPWDRNAPMFVDADMLTFWGQNDVPQGEFWVREGYTPSPMTNAKYAASASHIYGCGLTALEAFTHMTRHWTMYPSILKPSADQNLIDGGNMFIWHTYTAPVPDTGKPGIEYFAGTHINSNVTWQSDAGPFITYLGRCQAMLRAGLYTADFCVYVSDRNYHNWGRGQTWSDWSGWGPPKGTAFDLFDTNALITRLEWKNGRFVLPDGMSYRWLVYDPENTVFPLAALEKIVRLAEAGGHVILGPNRPKMCIGLSDGPEGDARFAELVNRLWADGSPAARPFGRGIVYTGMTPPEVMRAESTAPDFEGPFEYHHRSCGQGDIFFVVNTEGRPVRAMCRFRTDRSSASLWNPATGGISVLRPENEEDGGSDFVISLPEYGSCFVVFTDTPPEGAETPEPVRHQTAREISGPWRVRFDPALGGPDETIFTKLTLWNENEDPAVRYYSGSAEYETSFTLSAEEIQNPNLTLDIGRAAVIARVFINGADAGVLWTFPWRLPLGKGAVKELLREGENRLTIRVTNTWANRLIGDASLPPEERLSETNTQFYSHGSRFSAWQGYMAGEPLRESGLIGPVRLLE